MNTLKFPFFAILLMFVGCASIDKYDQPDYHRVVDAKKLEGTYKNVPFNVEYRTYHTFDNAINWRKKTSDTTRFSSVNLQILDHKQIRFTFSNQQGNTKAVTAKYKVKDGFVSIKNRNFKLNGLPYIFGDYQINKMELGLTNANQLIMNGTRVNEGALLLVFWSPPGWKYLYKFDRNDQ